MPWPDSENFSVVTLEVEYILRTRRFLPNTSANSLSPILGKYKYIPVKMSNISKINLFSTELIIQPVPPSLLVVYHLCQYSTICVT